MKLATTTGDFSAYTNSQSVALAGVCKAGFKYADYSFGMDYKYQNGIYSDDFYAYVDSINKTAEELKIKLVQAHSPIGKPFEDNGELLKRTLKCVDACGAWGIKNLVVHSGYSYGFSKQKTFEENKKFFLPLLERAEKHGVNILVENFNKMCLKDIFWIDNATDLLELIKKVNHPLFHAIWDVGHGNLQEMTQYEELALLKGHVKAIHVHDNMGDNDTHQTPFFGTVNWDSVMHGLSNIGYDGYFTFEVTTPFCPASKRRAFEKDSRQTPMELINAFEGYLYGLGKCILEKYNCFEE